jgi:stage V sporulation protein G
MKVTNVTIFLTGNERVRALAYIILDEQLVVNDIMIVQARDGLFVMMPVRKKRNGEFKEVACATTNEARLEIEEAVFGAYTEAVAAKEKESITSARDAVSWEQWLDSVKK